MPYTEAQHIPGRGTLWVCLFILFTIGIISLFTEDMRGLGLRHLTR